MREVERRLRDRDIARGRLCIAGDGAGDVEPASLGQSLEGDACRRPGRTGDDVMDQSEAGANRQLQRRVIALFRSWCD